MSFRIVIQRNLLKNKNPYSAFLPLWFSYFLLFLSFSCVPLGKQKYMQDYKSDEAPIIEAKEYELNIPKYKLKAEDVVSVEVFSLTQEKFNFLGSTPKMELTVNQQGNIELPVVGNLKVAGLTLEQTKEKITVSTVDYLKSPKVTVKLVSFNFTVLGEVSSQGTFKVEQENLTVLQAIAQAGGLTQYADRSNIRILRHEQANASVYTVNVQEDNLLLSDRYFIQPNDVILVDPLKAKSVRQDQLSLIGFAFSFATSIALVILQFLR